MSGVEIIGLASSYVTSIVILSSLLWRREQGNKTASESLHIAKECAKRLEGAIDQVVKQENIKTSVLDQLCALVQELPAIRDSLSEFRSLRDLRSATATLQDLERHLNEAIVQGNEPSDDESDLSDGSVTPTIEPLKVVLEPQYFNTGQLNSAGSALHLIHRPDRTPTSDIIFVHGLNSDAESTWASSTKDRMFWPRDLLAEDASESAIWIYAYNSEIYKSGTTREPLSKVFRTLGSDLRLSVQRETRSRLIWVGHSLGGYLIKTALTLTSTKQEADWEEETNTASAITSRTRGVIFMGTPHTGSSLGARASCFTTMLSTRSSHHTATRREKEVLELRLDSTMIRVTSDFAALMDRKGFPIWSLFESKPTLVESGPQTIVEAFSKLNHPKETTGILEGNHLSMCKFQAREERGYALVLKAIKDIQKNISFQLLKPESPKQMPSPMSSKATSISDADTIDTEALYTDLRLKFDVPATRWHSAKLGSYADGLWFPASDRFDRWFRGTRRQPLLIQGPAGCGKTMMAESVLEHLRYHAVRQNLSHSICQLHIFFRSDQITYQSPINIIVALIAQTLDHDSSLGRHFRKAPSLVEKPAAFTQALLRGTLRKMLEDTCWQEIYLVVDALDECHESFVQSSLNIIAWMLEIPKVYAVLTNSTGKAFYRNLVASEASSQNTDLASLLRIALWRNYKWFDIVDVRAYAPWIQVLDAYISRRLELTGKQEFRQTDAVTALPISARTSLRAFLLSLPHLSFTVVDFALQAFNRADSLHQDQPLELWFGERLHQLEAASILYDALFEMACRMSPTCVQILSLLCCAQEPLRLPECCSLWKHGLYLNVPDTDENLSPEELYDIVTSGKMPLLVTVGGNGLHLSSDVVRQAISLQMKQLQASETVQVVENKFSGVFESYERFNCRIAQSCLQILQHGVQSHGWAYANKHYSSHLLQAGTLAKELDTLLKHYYENHTSLAFNLDYEPMDAHQSRILRRLTENNLSVNLGSIFSNVTEGVEYPARIDIEAALQDPPSQATLVEMQKINSKSTLRGVEKEQQSSKLEIVMAIQKHDVETLKPILGNSDFSLDDKMAFLRLAIDLLDVPVVGLVLQHFKEALLPPDHKGRELLRRAVLYQNRDIVTTMLRYRHMFDMNSAFIAAVTTGNISICEDLLACGADIRVASRRKEAVLHVATTTNSPPLITALLRWNADVNALDAKNRTALHLAAERGHTEVAKILIKNSASLTKRDHSGRSPFFAACAQGHPGVARLLRLSGADLKQSDKRERSLLHAAASSGHQEILEMLIAAGTDVNVRDQLGITPLQEAAEHGWAPIVDRLLQLKADFKATCCGGATALHFACTTTNAPEAVVISLLQQAGADPRPRDVLGRTPLHLAVHLSTVRVVQILAELGENMLQDTDSQGRDVIDYLHAANPLDFKREKITSKERSEQNKRKEAYEEKRSYLASKIHNASHRMRNYKWEAISIRALAEQERSKMDSRIE